MPKAKPHTTRPNPRPARPARPAAKHKQPAYQAISRLNIQTLPDDLPAAAWELLYRITLDRLRRCGKQGKRWAAATAHEANELNLTWRLCGLAQDTVKAEQWLYEVQSSLMSRQLPTRGRPTLEPSAWWLFPKYRVLHEGIRAMRKAERKEKPKNVDAFYRERLVMLLRELGPVWLDGKLIYRQGEIPITAQMVNDVKRADDGIEPSFAAAKILASLWGKRSAGHLKNEFVQATKSNSPLHLWRAVLQKGP